MAGTISINDFNMIFSSYRKHEIVLLGAILLTCLPLCLFTDKFTITYGEIIIFMLGWFLYLKICLTRNFFLHRLPKEIIILFLFILFIFLSTLNNNIDSDGVKMQIRYIEIFVFAFIFYIYFVINRVCINRLLKYFFISLLFVAVFSLINYLVLFISYIFDFHLNINMMDGDYINYGGSFGLLMALLCQLSAYFFVKTTDRKNQHLLLGIMLIISFIFLLLCSKRTWILFGVIGIITQLFFYKKTLLVITYIFFIFLLLFFIGNDPLELTNKYFSNINEITLSNYKSIDISTDSVVSRFDKWKNTLDYFYSSPLYGAGLENPRSGLASWNSLLGNRRADNQYIDLLAMTGVFPLLCLFYLIYLLIKKTYLLFSHERKLALLVGMMLQILFGGAFFWQIFLWIFGSIYRFSFKFIDLYCKY